MIFDPLQLLEARRNKIEMLDNDIEILFIISYHHIKLI